MTRLFLPLMTLLAVACVKPEPAVAPAPSAPLVARAPSEQAAVRVEVWHDTICPWCRIGLHNLDVALSGMGDVAVEVVHHPYLLDPGAPAEGRDLQAHYGTMFGPEQLKAMNERVAQAGAAAGLNFEFSKMKVAPATVASHALIEWAPEGRRTAVTAAVQRAHFEEGHNIGDAQVLGDIAASLGLDRNAAVAAVTDPERLADIRRQAGQAQQAGVRGVPHFVVNGRALNGARSPEDLRAAIVAAAR